MRPKLNSLDAIIHTVQMVLLITPKTPNQQPSLKVRTWWCGAGFHITGWRMNGNMMRHSWWKSAAIYEDDDEETRVNISAKWWSQTHSQGNPEDLETVCGKLGQNHTWAMHGLVELFLTSGEQFMTTAPIEIYLPWEMVTCSVLIIHVL